VTFTVGDETVTLTDEPFTFTLDPAAYAPGDYSLTVSAEDANGDVGSAEVAFTIAALPSEVTTSPDLASLGTISEPIDVTLVVSGQTPLASAEYSLQGPAFADDVLLPVDADNTITIYPQFLTPGDNLLTVQVTNEGGVTSTQVFPLTIASLPPTVSVDGVQEGQIIDAPITFEIAASGQTPTVEVTISVDDMVLEPADDGSYTLDPMTLEPGAHTVTITATDENNQTITTEVGVIISPLPPTIVATGLNDGDELTEDTPISLEFVSQTPIVAVTVQLDGEELAQLESEPFDITLQPLEIAPGEHTLTIIAENASSQQSTLDIDFIVAEGPSLTATALAPTPTGAATQTPDDRATRTEQAAALAGVRTATAEAVNEQATETGEANTAATQTERAGATETSQASAGATETSQANAVATRTAIAQATQNMQMTASQEGRASATSDARATSQAVAQQEALNSTREALATANVQARVNATETADARATRLSQSNATATQLVLLLASETAVGEVTATRSALETQVAISQATVDTQATRDAETEEANATQSGLATRNAQATERSNETATAVQQATDDTRMTAVGSTVVPTEETEITSVAQAAETSTARPSPTPQPTMTLVEAENPPATSDIAPIAILAIFLLIALVVAYLLYPRLKRPK
jgi:hypothetical protein